MKQRDDPRGITTGSPDADHDPGSDRPARRRHELAPHHVRADPRWLPATHGAWLSQVLRDAQRLAERRAA